MKRRFEQRADGFGTVDIVAEEVLLGDDDTGRDRAAAEHPGEIVIHRAPHCRAPRRMLDQSLQPFCGGRHISEARGRALCPAPPCLESNARRSFKFMRNDLLPRRRSSTTSAARFGEQPRVSSEARIGPMHAGQPWLHSQPATSATACSTTCCRRSKSGVDKPDAAGIVVVEEHRRPEVASSACATSTGCAVEAERSWPRPSVPRSRTTCRRPSPTARPRSCRSDIVSERGDVCIA